MPDGRERTGEGEAKTSPERREHISDMSAQEVSAYTRTRVWPTNTNRVMGAGGIHSCSERKRQKFHFLWCLKHGSPDDTTQMPLVSEAESAAMPRHTQPCGQPALQ